MSLLPEACKGRNRNEAEVFACALKAQPNGQRLLRIVRKGLAMTSRESRLIAKIQRRARKWVASQRVPMPKKRPFHKTRTPAKSRWAERGLKGGGVFVVRDKKSRSGASRVTTFSNGYVIKTSWDPSAQSYSTEILRSSRSRPVSEIEAKKAAKARAHHDNAVRRVIR